MALTFLLLHVCSRQYAKHSALVAARFNSPSFTHPVAVPVRSEGGSGRLRVGYLSNLSKIQVALFRWVRIRLHVSFSSCRYVSSDFGNHPLSHLMGSVFGMHNKENVEVLSGMMLVLLSHSFVLL